MQGLISKCYGRSYISQHRINQTILHPIFTSLLKPKCHSLRSQSNILNNIQQVNLTYEVSLGSKNVRSGFSLGIPFPKHAKIPSLYPDVSLSRWKCARKRKREEDNGRDGASPAVCTLPMVPCGSSPVTRVSRSPLPCEKRSAWGGGCRDT